MYDARVAAGAALLDERGPDDWRDKIDLDTLDVFSFTDCVLGQLYGRYNSGKDALDIWEGMSYGFDDSKGHHVKLTAAWKRYLTRHARIFATVA
jgi:hypothetical protein